MILLIIFLSVIFLGSASAWQKEEHQIVADRALEALLAEWNLALLKDKLTQEITFGEACARFAGMDSSAARHQRRGKTILKQLRPLTASLIEKVWSEHGQNVPPQNQKTKDVLPPTFSAEQADQSVIVNYFLHHLIALRLARANGENKDRKDETLKRALLYEASALSYLMDSFTAGHLLVPVDSLFKLHPINNRAAYDFYRNEGAYVINSQGDVWQTFGNKILQWHAPTYRKVVDACLTSLRELFLVYFVSADDRSMPEELRQWGQSVASGLSLEDLVNRWTSTREGGEYYSILRILTLLLLPMPVSASWSVRTDEVDEHGISRRHHYPQLRDLGFHDPDLQGIDQEFLYPRTAVPDWMVPEVLNTQSPAQSIKSHPEVASVRFHQTRDFPPSYRGLLFHIGGGPAFKKRGTGFGSHIGLGYGLTDSLLVIQKSSIGMALVSSFDEGRRLLLVPNLGFGLRLPSPSHLWEAYQFEIGYAVGLRSPYKRNGFKFGFGIEFPTVPLGFTYAGLTIRLMYQRYSLERTLHGIFLELLLH